MNKQKILEEINKTEEHLSNLKKMLEECEYKRWKPKEGEKYYALNRYEEATTDEWFDTCYNNDMFNLYNVFRTREQAEAEAEKILVRRQLEDIAKRLNKGKKIDWDDENQFKRYISYHNSWGIKTYSVCGSKTQGTVYCLDENFLLVAIQEIGEERLKNYLRGE